MDRESDLVKRGHDLLVHDYDGKIVLLSDAKEWYSFDSNYVEPRKYISNCDSILIALQNFFSILL